MADLASRSSRALWRASASDQTARCRADRLGRCSSRSRSSTLAGLDTPDHAVERAYRRRSDSLPLSTARSSPSSLCPTRQVRLLVHLIYRLQNTRYALHFDPRGCVPRHARYRPAAPRLAERAADRLRRRPAISPIAPRHRSRRRRPAARACSPTRAVHRRPSRGRPNPPRRRRGPDHHDRGRKGAPDADRNPLYGRHERAADLDHRCPGCVLASSPSCEPQIRPYCVRNRKS